MSEGGLRAPWRRGSARPGRGTRPPPAEHRAPCSRSPSSRPLAHPRRPRPHRAGTEPDADRDALAHRDRLADHGSDGWPGDVDGGRPRGRRRSPRPDRLARLGATELADPAVRADLAATYPGAAELLAAVDELNGRAEPAFIAVDPAAAGSGGPLAANLSVLVAQPSVGGPLLDLVAGFICDALTDALGAAASPERASERLPIGDAVRCTYDLPAGGGEPLVGEAWVIGAPAATVLVTLLGPASATAGVTAREIVGAIVPTP